jgi:hypothetical protein
MNLLLWQVLVVPRRQPARGKVRPREREREVSDEEILVAPQTPDRSTHSASTFSSPHSSVFSPHHLSRPYAQVPYLASASSLPPPHLSTPHPILSQSPPTPSPPPTHPPHPSPQPHTILPTPTPSPLTGIKNSEEHNAKLTLFSRGAGYIIYASSVSRS